MTDDCRRHAILQLLARYDAALRSKFSDELKILGPCLLLGRHYGESPVVYFSLNPGYSRTATPSDLSSTEPWNIPFLNPPELRRQYVYLHNCQKFFASDPGLYQWINGAVTSAFLVPWPTRNMAELERLNRAARGQVFEYARELARTLVEDHRAELLLLAGKAALQLMKSMRLLDSPVEQSDVHGPGGSYQWSKCRARIGGRLLTILQVPHFSRANSLGKMSGLAGWLRTELEPFGCGSLILADDE